MNDEERKKLVADLRLGVPDRPPRCCLTDRAAADEIERLAEENETLRVKTVHNLRLALNDKANEIERLTKELQEAKRYDMRDFMGESYENTSN